MSKILLFADRLISLNCTSAERDQISSVFSRLKIRSEWFQPERDGQTYVLKFLEALPSELFYKSVFNCLEDEDFEVFGYFNFAEPNKSKTRQFSQYIKAACSVINGFRSQIGTFEDDELEFQIDFGEQDENKINISLGLADRPDIRISELKRFAYIERAEMVIGKGETLTEAFLDFMIALSRVAPDKIALSSDDVEEQQTEQELFEQFKKLYPATLRFSPSGLTLEKS